MPPDIPSSRLSKERAPEAVRVAFGDELDALEKATGPVPPALPDTPNENNLNDAERALTGDNKIGGFYETFRVNEIQQQRNALQRQAALKDKPDANAAAELAMVNNAITYYQYIPGIISDTVDVMRRYEDLRGSIPAVTPEVEKGEKQAESYLNGLSGAIRERTAYANILLIDSRLSKHVGDAPTLMKMREEYLKSADLSPASRNALNGSQNEKQIQGNLLNQRIVDVLSGKATIEGVDKGFQPAALYMKLLQTRYEALLNEQREAAKGPGLSRARARYSVLLQKNNEAKAGRGEPLTDAEIREYEKLQQQIEDRQGFVKLLEEGRKEITQELMVMTDRLAADQIDRAELATIQSQFGQSFDFAGVSAPVRDVTPGNIRVEMAKQMEQRSEFHMERLQEFTEVVDGDVLGIGVMERVEDVSNEYGREVVRRAANTVAKLFTLVVPEEFGLKQMAQDALVGPLNEALGWPAGKTKWEELTPSEQKTVEEKSKSVLDAIREFDRSTIKNFQETISLTRSMPPAETYVGQDIPQVLPEDRVTPANRDALIAQYGGATVYAMLFRQMEADFGDTEPASGFMKEYTTFFKKIDSTIDVHIEVGEAAFKLRDAYDKLMWGLIAAAAAVFGTGVLVGTLGLRRTYRLATSPVRAGAKLTRFGAKATVKGVRLGGKVVGQTSRQLGQLSEFAQSTSTGEQLTRMRYLESERRFAEMLKKVPGAKAIAARMEALAASRVARGAGKVARIGGWAMIPAMTAYEYYEGDVRADAAAGNEQLQAQYEEDKSRTLTQGAGLMATLALPGIVSSVALGAPIVLAGEYAGRRSDVLANWKRTGADWAREYDAAGLRGALNGMTDTAAVEAGGGGTLRPRVTLPSSKDQKEAYKLMESANANSRAEAYEAYFRQTQPLLPGATPDQLDTIIRDKMQYLRIATQGTFQPDLMNAVLQQADTYAELMQRRRAGEALINYEAADGSARSLDLNAMAAGGSDMMRIVDEYRQIVQPAEEVAMFMMIGERANSRLLPSAREKDRKNAERGVRTAVLLKLMNHLQDAESIIRSTDWPGIDAYIVNGNTASQNIVRTYLADRIIADLNTLIPAVLGGKMDPDTYAQRITAMENILLEPKNATDVTAYVRTAEAYIAGQKREPRADALGQLLRGTAE